MCCYEIVKDEHFQCADSTSIGNAKECTKEDAEGKNL